MIDSIPDWLLWSYLASVAVELYFFLMQRSALEICRASQLPDQARLMMLPSWYRLVWLPRILKWVAIAMVFARTGLDWGIAALVLPFMLAAWFPVVPHRHFAPLFAKTLSEQSLNPDAAIVKEALQGSGAL
ncbi:MAG: hypothetical protein HEQ38_07110 [Gemmatimonas sp.]|jgi:hypothetical protein|nr:hypothetical protein [Gemmatimonas sp.]